MFTPSDPNTTIFGGTNSKLNSFWNFVPYTKNYLRMIKL